MAENFADRLLEAIEEKGAPVCVGLDPDLERLPAPVRSPGSYLSGDFNSLEHDLQPVVAMQVFCQEVIKAVADVVPAVKPQIACFERFGAQGIACYERVVAAAHHAGLLVIGDVKRNDIGSTAAHYAAAHLGRDGGPDAITVNGYLGADGLVPFIDVARAAGKGIFVLVRTSNPSAASVQDFADASGKKLYEHVAGIVAALGCSQGCVGRRGYSCVGAVVGATWPGEARRLREIMPQQLFLLPGYGAQGASAEDCAAAFKPDGTGAIVNAARSVIYAFSQPQYRQLDWREAVAQAAAAFAADIRSAVANRA